MTKEQIAALEVSAAEAKTKADAAGGKDENLNTLAKNALETLAQAKAALPPDPLDTELEKVNKSKRTELEKAEFAKLSIEKRIAELKGAKPAETVVPTGEPDDNAPVTYGDLRKRDAEKAAKTAVELAGNIKDEKERTLVIHHLQSTIKSTGNPEEDLKLAYSIVYGKKNAQVIEEITRTSPPRTSGTGTGAPPPHRPNFVPTEHERSLMRPPFNLSQAEIESARDKEAQART